MTTTASRPRSAKVQYRVHRQPKFHIPTATQRIIIITIVKVFRRQFFKIWFPMTCEDAHRHHRRTIVPTTTISTSPHSRPSRVICPSRPSSCRISSVSATFRTSPARRILLHYSRPYKHNNKYRITCCCKRPPIRTLIHRRLMRRHSSCCKVKFNRRWHRPPSNYNRYKNSSSSNTNNISSISRSKIDSRCDSHRRLIWRRAKVRPTVRRAAPTSTAHRRRCTTSRETSKLHRQTPHRYR